MNYLMFKAVLQSMQYELSKNKEGLRPLLFSENRYQRATSEPISNLTYCLKQVY
jgi:hypothetical protein